LRIKTSKNAKSKGGAILNIKSKSKKNNIFPIDNVVHKALEIFADESNGDAADNVAGDATAGKE
jgi:hypothetical protein